MVRCAALTKRGTQCKRPATYGRTAPGRHPLCRQHFHAGAKIVVGQPNPERESES
jgi:hypothetical protein